VLDQRLALVLRSDEPPDLQRDVRPVEPSDDLHRVGQSERPDDLLADVRRGGGGHRHHRRMSETLDDLPEPLIVGAEVVPPGGDAVGLVDRDQRRSGLHEPFDDVGLGELFRGQEHERRVPGRHLLQSRGHGGGRVHRHGAARVGLEQAGHLVTLERDQRRDDDRRSLEQQRGKLVDCRLAAPGRHDEQHVTPVEQVLHRLLLARSQLLPAEALPGRGP
jgi:hypothetical protein